MRASYPNESYRLISEFAERNMEVIMAYLQSEMYGQLINACGRHGAEAGESFKDNILQIHVSFTMDSGRKEIHISITLWF